MQRTSDGSGQVRNMHAQLGIVVRCTVVPNGTKNLARGVAWVEGRGKD